MGFTIPNVERVYPFEVLGGLDYMPNILQEFKFGRIRPADHNRVADGLSHIG